MKKAKRILGVVLIVLMLCSTFVITPISVSAYATGDDYPSKYKSLAIDSVTDEWNFYNRECTSFVAWCLNSRNGVGFTNWYGGVRWGNADNWGNAARSVGITVDSNPAVGSVAWTTSCHVAWVKEVSGDTIIIDEYNWNGDGKYHERTLNKNSFSGYIHIKDISTSTDNQEPAITIPTGTKSIGNGNYYITSALDNNKVLDIDDGQISNNKANAQLWDLLKGANQVFSIKHIGDGYYNIVCKKSGKFLEVEGGYKNAGSNVQQFDGNGTDAQQWVIKETGDGFFYIVSKCNGLYLDVNDGKTGNGTNVKVYTGNSSNAQKWRFVLLSTQNFCDGDYYITSALDNNKVLDVDDGQISKNKANAQLWALLKGENQVFSIKHIGEGYYNIICKKSGKCLEIAGGYANAGTNVQQYDSNGTDAQQWVIKDVGDNYFCIVSKLNGLYLDVNDGKTDNGTNVKVYTGNSSKAQKWRFIPLGTQTIKDDDYYITSELDNNKVLDIDDGNITNNKANAQLWSLQEGTNQVFTLKYNDDGYYSIICKKSDKCLEVEGGYKSPGTNVQQFDSNGTDAQQWVIKEAGDGFFYIVSKCSGLYLDVNDGKTDNGTNVKVYTGNLSNAQKWKIIKVENNTSTETQPVTDKPTEPTSDKPTEPVTAAPEVTIAPESTAAPEATTAEPTEAPTEAAQPAPDKAGKADNPIKVTGKTKTVKISKLKKKAQTVKALTVKNAQGKVSYKLIKKGSTAKIFRLVKINSKGVITINKWKKAKKGTYTIKVKITAKGNDGFSKKTLTKAVKIRMK